MEKLTSGLFILFACVVITIGQAIFLTGPHATASFFDYLVGPLFETNLYETGLQDANTGSEMRFFSVFWTVFGLIMLRCAFDVSAYRNKLLVLLFIFFMGGVGRVLAHASSGTPDLLFVALGWIELSLPFVLGALLWFGVKRNV